MGTVILCAETQERLWECSGSHLRIIEIGSWIGFSALRLAEWNPQATILCIDPWLGSFELQKMDELQPQIANSYEQFLANTAHLADRIWPYRTTGVDGLLDAHEKGFDATLIFIDGSHQYESVWGDIHAARRAFPKATLVLDDLKHPGVKQAVLELIPETVITANSGVFRP
jgi:hypothetical protein